MNNNFTNRQMGEQILTYAKLNFFPPGFERLTYRYIISELQNTIFYVLDCVKKLKNAPRP